MELRIKQESHKEFMTTLSGLTITKNEWTKVDENMNGVNYLLSRSDVEVKESIEIKKPVEKKPVKEKIFTKKTVKKEIIKDNVKKESFKAVVESEE